MTALGASSPPPLSASPFARGVRAALDGLRLAIGDAGVRKAYLRVVLGIFALTLVIDVLALWGLFTAADPSQADAIWLEIVYWIARILGAALVLLIGPLLAIFTINIAFPFFNEGIFMAALRSQDPARAERVAAGRGLSIASAAGTATIRLIRFLAGSLLFLVIGLIPVIGSVIGAVGQTWLTARTVAWEMIDPWFDRLGMGWTEQKAFVKQHERSLLGFGLPLSLILAIPLAGPFLFGLIQASAATWLVREVPSHPRELESLNR